MELDVSEGLDSVLASMNTCDAGTMSSLLGFRLSTLAALLI